MHQEMCQFYVKNKQANKQKTIIVGCISRMDK